MRRKLDPAFGANLVWDDEGMKDVFDLTGRPLDRWMHDLFYDARPVRGKGLISLVSRRSSLRLLGFALIPLIAAGCGFSSDQWFTLTITNDTASKVVLLEPCPGCHSPGVLARLGPGVSYRLPVLANRGVKTYVVSDELGKTLGCLPISYSSVPADKEAGISKLEQRCPS